MIVNSKVILVTGGGTGIGEATARALSTAGYHVAVFGRRQAEVERVANEIDGLAISGDATDPRSIERAVSQIKQAYGRLDGLVHCAGTYESGGAAECSDAQWTRIIDVNLTSAFITSRAVLPDLIESKGSIVIISSSAGIEAIPQSVGYVTTKHALIGLMRSMALDYGPLGVRVNVVCPGWTRTAMADHEMEYLIDHHGTNLDGAYSIITGDVPLRRASQPSEIAAVCKFLVDDSSSIITGAVITADGGTSIVCAAATRM